ncbi:hypothetical protein [Sphingomonas sp. CFBP 13706]|uniref:hypothetical protein n=1 Tax=Sphingomonas sp. CFBP 13706 TaxID=2775314 RepID=UPI001781914D|nr:hypothetical protein [Sphingomonas sp. CFBP 13706]MBD8736244.1 hypothetical protein [Sphingomonas sp. CFBP 13706]
MTEEARPARHADPTLLGLAELNATMNDAATESERRSWWEIVQRTQSSLDGDARAAKADHDAIRRLRDSVTEVYSALNGRLYPDYSGAKRAISGMQRVLEARTTGFDGYPLG